MLVVIRNEFVGSKLGHCDGLWRAKLVGDLALVLRVDRDEEIMGKISDAMRQFYEKFDAAFLKIQGK